LIACGFDRLDRLMRRMLHDFPGEARWEQASDVRHAALARLARALDQSPPATLREFLRLAAGQIRRELIDLARHYQGSTDLDWHHAGAGDLPSTSAATPVAAPELDETTDQSDPLVAWTEFHQRVEELPEEQREAFDLLWYQGLTQVEAAAVLGVAERTIQRRWLAARLQLYKELEGRLPRL
jgi:RNA polymerase sigma-70 factor (ECF subfamily)